MEKGKTLKFSSIAISGRPGAGRATLIKNLRPIIEPLGWDCFSGGEWARQYAIERGKHHPDNPVHHKAADYSDDIDHKIDGAMREKISDSNVHMVIESWIAGWNARGFKHVLKVLLMCDDALRIDRIVNRDNLSVEDAKKHLEERERENMTKWRRMYGTGDFWDPKHYDLVINTYSRGPSETLDLVLQALGYFKANGQIPEA